MDFQTFNYQLTILERHLDTFGHMNNATYLQIYEESRWDFITKNGFGLDRIQELKLGPVILDLHLTFKKEIKNREQITITSKVTEIKNPLVSSLKQEMRNENGDLCSTLELNVGLMDLQKRKLIPPTDDWKKAVGMVD
ncbi:acyl-CoA thioesterase [Bacteriovoracaceae bacterium]|nr:acyl-CoA thioesterase [Bacteriovoracaceae bacterium]